MCVCVCVCVCVCITDVEVELSLVHCASCKTIRSEFVLALS